ncbi:hypothetical protein D0Z00_001719 [Geotrichum galactomycetum]|uniref:Uncharacterized protein n=1 Tax=Geotrichum galactomycetum TaxID=27317 RepID=A0ACB6V6I1_9ASCO|nr:hypothetical protein D0Z00_001719 [Geotrichum candidum]
MDSKALNSYFDAVSKNLELITRLREKRLKTDFDLLLSQYLLVLNYLDEKKQYTPIPLHELSNNVETGGSSSKKVDWKLRDDYLYPFHRRFNPKRPILKSKSRNYHPFGFPMNEVDIYRRKFYFNEKTEQK